MAQVGYFIISVEQAAILDILEISYQTLGGVPCVEDWDALTNAIEEAVWADGEISDLEDSYLEKMANYVKYRYWSTEGHTWI